MRAGAEPDTAPAASLEETRRLLRAAEERRDTPEILRLRAELRLAADKQRVRAMSEQAISLLNRSFR
jgi:hypothetical protein